MSQYKISTEQILNSKTYLKSYQETLKDAAQCMSRNQMTLALQSMNDVSKTMKKMSNVRSQILNLRNDINLLQNALTYIEDKSGDADRQANNFLLSRGFINPIEDLLDVVVDRIKEWTNTDNIIENSESDTNTDNRISKDTSDSVNSSDNEPLNEDVNSNQTTDETISSPVTNYSNNLPQQNNDYSKYKVISNISSEYCYNQKNYDKFISPNSGKNVGCTATAIAIAYSIYHNEPLDPTVVPWSSNPSSVGVSNWDQHTNILFSGGSYSTDDALRACYEQLNNGVPVIIRLTGGHSITVVGVKDGADINNLSMNDFLIVDPNDGKLKYLDEESWFGRIDTSWSLRVPK